jgi:hypothetical protein
VAAATVCITGDDKICVPLKRSIVKKKEKGNCFHLFSIIFLSLFFLSLYISLSALRIAYDGLHAPLCEAFVSLSADSGLFCVSLLSPAFSSSLSLVLRLFLFLFLFLAALSLSASLQLKYQKRNVGE